MFAYFIYCFVLSLFVRTEGCSVCPDGIRKFVCFEDPCMQRSCDGATCSSNYCGGCNRLWYQNGSDVTKRCEFICPGSNCLPGVATASCSVRPCSLIASPARCPGYPSATCCESYCGGCHAVWYSNGEPVTCQQRG